MKAVHGISPISGFSFLVLRLSTSSGFSLENKREQKGDKEQQSFGEWMGSGAHGMA